MKRLFILLFCMLFLFSTTALADDQMTIMPADDSSMNYNPAPLSADENAKLLQADVYTITFDSNGGSYVPSQTVGEGSTAIMPDDPVLIHYQFLGWFTEDNVEYTFTEPVKSDLTLTAYWALKASDKVTITLIAGDKNGGSKFSDNKYQKKVTQKEGTRISNLPKPKITKTLTFSYYTDEMPVDWTDYTCPAFDTSAPIYNDVVLYAIYYEEDNSDKFLKVTFDANDGHFDDEDDGPSTKSVTVSKGSKVSKPDDPKRKNYEFKGWYYDSDGGDKVDFGDEITESKTYYAHWKKKDDSSSSSSPYTHSSSSSMSLTPEQLLTLAQLTGGGTGGTGGTTGTLGTTVKMPKTGVGFPLFLILAIVAVLGVLVTVIYKFKHKAT